MTVRGLGPELHILFAITITATLLFLVHAFLRLRAARRRARARRRQRAARRVAGAEADKAMRGPAGGFAPVVPIRVHLARDEEIVLDEEVVDGDGSGAEDDEVRGSAAAAAAAGGLRVPPPAYGLWRSSVVSRQHASDGHLLTRAAEGESGAALLAARRRPHAAPAERRGRP
jgi:hypothetical protein